MAIGGMLFLAQADHHLVNPGLAIVKAIAEAHGGTVSVSSTAGRTCFSIRLPWAPCSA